MKSRILTLVALFVALSFSGVYAQVETDIHASATVFDALTLTAETPVAFGNVAVGFTPNIDVVNQSQEDVGSTWTEGVFAITGADGQNVLVSFPNTVNLVSTGGTPLATEIEYTLQVANDARTAITSGGAVELSGTTGEQTLYVGGSLETITAQMSGTYEATIAFSIEYQ